MTIVAFAGPSLPAAERARFAGVDWRPPAEAGDLLRLDLAGVTAICMIDGYFDHRPAVRHKEILLLLSEGVPIFGASSIGALRAAEMCSFGMIGVGAIFGAYARGAIDGDDEVALIHAEADRDWRPLSLPLVDIRATLCRARRAGRIAGRDARILLQAARSVHYVDRDENAILIAAAAQSGHTSGPAWLADGMVEQKRADALECLQAAATGAGCAPRRPALIRTRFLDLLARDCNVDLDSRPRQNSPRQQDGRSREPMAAA